MRSSRSKQVSTIECVTGSKCACSENCEKVIEKDTPKRKCKVESCSNYLISSGACYTKSSKCFRCVVASDSDITEDEKENAELIAHIFADKKKKKKRNNTKVATASIAAATTAAATAAATTTTATTTATTAANLAGPFATTDIAIATEPHEDKRSPIDGAAEEEEDFMVLKNSCSSSSEMLDQMGGRISNSIENSHAELPSTATAATISASSITTKNHQLENLWKFRALNAKKQRLKKFSFVFPPIVEYLSKALDSSVYIDRENFKRYRYSNTYVGVSPKFLFDDSYGHQQPDNSGIEVGGSLSPQRLSDNFAHSRCKCFVYARSDYNEGGSNDDKVISTKQYALVWVMDDPTVAEFYIEILTQEMFENMCECKPPMISSLLSTSSVSSFQSCVSTENNELVVDEENVFDESSSVDFNEETNHNPLSENDCSRMLEEEETALLSSLSSNKDTSSSPNSENVNTEERVEKENVANEKFTSDEMLRGTGENHGTTGVEHEFNNEEEQQARVTKEAMQKDQDGNNLTENKARENGDVETAKKHVPPEQLEKEKKMFYEVFADAHNDFVKIGNYVMFTVHGRIRWFSVFHYSPLNYWAKGDNINLRREFLEVFISPTSSDGKLSCKDPFIRRYEQVGVLYLKRKGTIRLFFSKCRLLSKNPNEDLFLAAIFRTLCNAPYTEFLVYDFKMQCIIVKKMYMGHEDLTDYYWCDPDCKISDDSMHTVNEHLVKYCFKNNLYFDESKVYIARDTTDPANPTPDPNYQEKNLLWTPILGTLAQNVLAAEKQQEANLLLDTPPPPIQASSEAVSEQDASAPTEEIEEIIDVVEDEEEAVVVAEASGKTKRKKTATQQKPYAVKTRSAKKGSSKTVAASVSGNTADSLVSSSSSYNNNKKQQVVAAMAKKSSATTAAVVPTVKKRAYTRKTQQNVIIELVNDSSDDDNNSDDNDTDRPKKKMVKKKDDDSSQNKIYHSSTSTSSSQSKQESDSISTNITTSTEKDIIVMAVAQVLKDSVQQKQINHAVSSSSAASSSSNDNNKNNKKTLSDGFSSDSTDDAFNAALISSYKRAEFMQLSDIQKRKHERQENDEIKKATEIQEEKNEIKEEKRRKISKQQEEDKMDLQMKKELQNIELKEKLAMAEHNAKVRELDLLAKHQNGAAKNNSVKEDNIVSQSSQQLLHQQQQIMSFFILQLEQQHFFRQNQFHREQQRQVKQYDESRWLPHTCHRYPELVMLQQQQQLSEQQKLQQEKEQELLYLLTSSTSPFPFENLLHRPQLMQTNPPTTMEHAISNLNIAAKSLLSNPQKTVEPAVVTPAAIATLLQNILALPAAAAAAQLQVPPQSQQLLQSIPPTVPQVMTNLHNPAPASAISCGVPVNSSGCGNIANIQNETFAKLLQNFLSPSVSSSATAAAAQLQVPPQSQQLLQSIPPAVPQVMTNLHNPAPASAISCGVPVNSSGCGNIANIQNETLAKLLQNFLSPSSSTQL